MEQAPSSSLSPAKARDAKREVLPAPLRRPPRRRSRVHWRVSRPSPRSTEAGGRRGPRTIPRRKVLCSFFFRHHHRRRPEATAAKIPRDCCRSSSRWYRRAPGGPRPGFGPLFRARRRKRRKGRVELSLREIILSESLARSLGVEGEILVKRRSRAFATFLFFHSSERFLEGSAFFSSRSLCRDRNVPLLFHQSLSTMASLPCRASRGAAASCSSPPTGATLRTSIPAAAATLKTARRCIPCSAVAAVSSATLLRSSNTSLTVG